MTSIENCLSLVTNKNTRNLKARPNIPFIYNFSIGCKEVVYILNKRVLETFREFFLCGVFLRALIYGNLKKFDITQNKDVYFPGKRFIIFHDFKVCFTDVGTELKRLLVKNMRTQLHGFLEL